MLTKDFHREFIPGTPGRPEVPAREAYTVCLDPPQGEWQEFEQYVYFTPDVMLRIPGRTAGPFGPIQLEVNYRNPYTGQMYPQNTWVLYIIIYHTVWVPFANPGPPICTTYPAQPYVPAVPPVPPHWEMTPRIGWDAGANSRHTQNADCELRFESTEVAGAYIGLTYDHEDVTDPWRIAHGFYFRLRGGQPHVSVVEHLATRSNAIPYTPGTEFAVRRAGGVVSYWMGATELYVSSEPSHGEVSVGCCLYASGDTLPATTSGGGGGGGDDALTEFEFEGEVPPNASESFLLAAGDWHFAENADGASCDWVIEAEGLGIIAEGTEGSEDMASLGADTLVTVTTSAYLDGGPFRVVGTQTTEVDSIVLSGSVPPNYESDPFLLPAGAYVISAASVGGYEWWFGGDEAGMIQDGVDGDTVGFELEAPAEVYLLVYPLSPEAPTQDFEVTISPAAVDPDL